MLRRLAQWLREFLGFSGLPGEPQDPEVLLLAQKDIFSRKLAHYDRSLAASASLCELLRNQIQEVERSEQSLHAALDAHPQSGKPDPAAGELAARWHATRTELADLAEQLQHAETICHEITAAREAAIQEAQKQFAQFKGTLGEHRIQHLLAEVVNKGPAKPL